MTIHSILIEEFGGTPGIRDQGALASALMRPQLGYYDGLMEEAAALMESLANNHPFVDGNKRVAFFVTDAFLRLNGQYIDCDSLEAFEFFMRLFETESFRYAALLPWLEAKVQPLPGR
ncbi:MAG: type II toxin-antitoxin system death-on-curing family toxin [Caldilineaceae bacterium]|nr:type II toxin-antitoxin system death-on-curing family toxin [Caldilineaceae bacterium]